MKDIRSLLCSFTFVQATSLLFVCYGFTTQCFKLYRVLLRRKTKTVMTYESGHLKLLRH